MKKQERNEDRRGAGRRGVTVSAQKGRSAVDRVGGEAGAISRDVLICDVGSLDQFLRPPYQRLLPPIFRVRGREGELAENDWAPRNFYGQISGPPKDPTAAKRGMPPLFFASRRPDLIFYALQVPLRCLASSQYSGPLFCVAARIFPFFRLDLRVSGAIIVPKGIWLPVSRAPKTLRTPFFPSIIFCDLFPLPSLLRYPCGKKEGENFF